MHGPFQWSVLGKMSWLSMTTHTMVQKDEGQLFREDAVNTQLEVGLVSLVSTLAWWGW